MNDEEKIFKKDKAEGAEGNSDSAYILYYHRAETEVHYEKSGKATTTETSTWVKALNRTRK
jgi:hypothetical protein